MLLLLLLVLLIPKVLWFAGNGDKDCHTLTASQNQQGEDRKERKKGKEGDKTKG